MDNRCGILIISEKWQPHLSSPQCVSHGYVTSVTAGFELKITQQGLNVNLLLLESGNFHKENVLTLIISAANNDRFAVAT